VDTARDLQGGLARTSSLYLSIDSSLMLGNSLTLAIKSGNGETSLTKEGFLWIHCRLGTIGGEEKAKNITTGTPQDRGSVWRKATMLQSYDIAGFSQFLPPAPKLYMRPVVVCRATP
jgi:hypothetical protein